MERKKPTLKDLIIVTVTVLIVATAISLFSMRVVQILTARHQPTEDENAKRMIANIEEEIELIAQVTAASTQLAEHMEVKKQKVLETQKLLDELTKEHSKLEPIVKTDRAVLQAVLNAQAEANEEAEKKRFWWDWSNGFFTGILSSFIVSPYWLAWTKAGWARWKNWRSKATEENG